MKNALSFVPTIRPNLRRLRIPFLSLTPFAHRYPSQTLLRLKFYQKLFFTHMHNWLSLYICRKNTYQSAVIRSISKCLAPKFASLFTASEPEVLMRNIARLPKSKKQRDKITETLIKEMGELFNCHHCENSKAGLHNNA